MTSSLKGLKSIVLGLNDEPTPIESQEISNRQKQPRTKIEREPVRVGKTRPIGKSRDPEFDKCTVYIRKATKKAVALELLQKEPAQELSELVEELLNAWALRRRGASPTKQSVS